LRNKRLKYNKLRRRLTNNKMKKNSPNKINFQSKETMKAMEMKIKQLKDELDVKADLVMKIKKSPATTTIGTKKSIKRGKYF
jgi:hypothetical protein